MSLCETGELELVPNAFKNSFLFRQWESRVQASGNEVISSTILGISTSKITSKVFAALVQAKIRAVNGVVYERTLTLRGDSVVIIPRISGQPPSFVMVEQFRIGSGKFSIEFPAGGIDPNESALQAATRELYEETGISVDGASFVSLTTDPLIVCESAFDEVAHWFLIDIEDDEVNLDALRPAVPYNEEEHTNVVLRSLSELSAINSFHAKTASQLLIKGGVAIAPR